MNIFVLDENPKLAAQYHCDKHVVKMILESAQMLSTAHAVIDNNGKQVEGMYKPTHVNHPCNIWVRESAANYYWLLQLFQYLLEEYTYRYSKHHKCEEMDPLLWVPPNNIDIPPTERKIALDVSPFAIAIADLSLIIPGYPVDSYRQYYREEKRHIAKWTKRATPYWWN